MIRVLLVDDQALVRSGFRVILETQADMEVVGEAADGQEAVLMASRLAPDVICMDVEMPVLNGIAATREILSTEASGTGHSAPAVLVLTTFGHEQYLFDALAAGVSGFLLKTSRAEQLIEAVRTLASGGALLSADVTRAVMQRAAELSHGEGRAVQRTDVTAAERALLSNTQAMDEANLTDREREVLGFIANGSSNAEIAQTLFLGEATVKTHVSKLLQKLGVRDRVQLVVWAHTVGSEAPLA